MWGEAAASWTSCLLVKSYICQYSKMAAWPEKAFRMSAFHEMKSAVTMQQ